MNNFKAIFIQGPPESGKSMSVGQIMFPLWEMRVCKHITENHEEELEKVKEDGRRFIHIEHFPDNPSDKILVCLDQLLENDTVIFITNENPPAKSLLNKIIWQKTQPFPYT